ncbi:glycosyltransferase [Acetobacter estunensis NRIC 0472]|uniref:Glycosyltransferase n=1 Tax=Acetobacter estunensis TaxID=104097 RepID=A0A967EDW0_9PROT|nr:glycosyltransferase family A protein [Acetobacter estunensis]NHO54711.1 glycosyltransferase [Acetobacter estunensis]GBQ21317.1 glycosyltransferase [Acetobacter estunensis NRIC 0472]
MALRSLIPPLAVAVPVRNEEERIGTCLEALARQEGAAFDHVVLLLNNCSDATLIHAQSLAPALPFTLTLVERQYALERAHAGTARREAMEVAADLVGPEGLLFTTDADGTVTSDWLIRTLAAFEAGAAVVCGRAIIDAMDAVKIPASLHDDDVAEVAYGTLLDHIHHLTDPDPADPWPRHTEHSGASIAVRVSAWKCAGGIPAVPSSEDRAFVAALRRIDMPIRHAPDVLVTVSGRTTGRAQGGMAETIARRIHHQDEMLDDALEPAVLCLKRAQARSALRVLWNEYPRNHDLQMLQPLASHLELTATEIAAWLGAPYFGQVWEAIERASPALRRQRVKRSELTQHHAAATEILKNLLAQNPLSTRSFLKFPPPQSITHSRERQSIR